MPRRPSKTPPEDNGFLPLPLDGHVWDQVAEEMQLSRQHRRIVELLLCGAKCKQLAPALGIAEPTVQTYLKRIYQRHGVAGHTELLLHIMRLSQRYHDCPKRHPAP